MIFYFCYIDFHILGNNWTVFTKTVSRMVTDLIHKIILWLNNKVDKSQTNNQPIRKGIDSPPPNCHKHPLWLLHVIGCGERRGRSFGVCSHSRAGFYFTLQFTLQTLTACSWAPSAHAGGRILSERGQFWSWVKTSYVHSVKDIISRLCLLHKRVGILWTLFSSHSIRIVI